MKHTATNKAGMKAWFKNLKLAPTLAAFFLFAQMVATAHVAAYGEAEHSHDGHPCIIAAAVKDTDDIDIAPPIFKLVDAEGYSAVISVSGPSLTSAETLCKQARAPPVSYL